MGNSADCAFCNSSSPFSNDPTSQTLENGVISMKTGIAKAGLAEAFGVFLLVFIGGSSICMDNYMTSDMRSTGLGVVGIAFAHGLALMLGVYASAGISGGHCNPAVTIGLWIIGKVEAARAIGYIVFQLLGGIIGGLFVLALFPDMRDNLPYLGAPRFISEGEGAISSIKAIGIEAIFTFILMMVVLLIAVDRGRVAKQMFGLCIGMTVTTLALIGGFTGGAMNPARHFGPALVSSESAVLSQVPVYFAGPIIGAIIAALVYKFVFATPDEETPAA